jgi:hypothetical protein
MIKQNNNNSPKIRILSAFLALVLVVITACSNNANVAPAVATIISPDPSTQLTLGKEAQIVGKISGGGVKSVDVFVNGNKYATVNQATASGDFQITVPWTPDQRGVNVIQIKGLGDKGEQIIQTSVIVNAQVPVVTTAPVAPTTAPAAPTQVASTPAPLPTTAPKPEANAISPKDEFVNVRTGPGTIYTRVGQINKNQSAPVIGKNADGTWWQVNFKEAPNNAGWVLAELVKFEGDATAIKVVSIPTPPPQPTRAAALPTSPPVVAVVPTSPPAPPQPSLPPSALLPYSQNMRFDPRDDIGDVPLGHNGPKTSKLVWEVNGAKSLELEITAPNSPGGIFSDCPAGDANSIQPQSAVNKRMSLAVPKGEFSFSIEGKGYYIFRIHVVKSDGSTTDIPRHVIVNCYKK